MSRDRVVAFLGVTLIFIIASVQASLPPDSHLVLLKDKTGHSFCAGALVTRRHVLTAAACVCGIDNVYSRSEIRVETPVQYRRHSTNSPRIQSISCQSPEGSYSYVFDFVRKVAVITLDRELALNKLQVPISLGEPQLLPGSALNLTNFNHYMEVPGYTRANVLQEKSCQPNGQLTAYRGPLCAFSTYGLFPELLGTPVIQNSKLAGIIYNVDGFKRPNKMYFFVDVPSVKNFVNGIIAADVRDWNNVDIPYDKQLMI